MPAAPAAPAETSLARARQCFVAPGEVFAEVKSQPGASPTGSWRPKYFVRTVVGRGDVHSGVRQSPDVARVQEQAMQKIPEEHPLGKMTQAQVDQDQSRSRNTPA